MKKVPHLYLGLLCFSILFMGLAVYLLKRSGVNIFAVMGFTAMIISFDAFMQSIYTEEIIDEDD